MNSLKPHVGFLLGVAALALILSAQGANADMVYDYHPLTASPLASATVTLANNSTTILSFSITSKANVTLSSTTGYIYYVNNNPPSIIVSPNNPVLNWTLALTDRAINSQDSTVVHLLETSPINNDGDEDLISYTGGRSFDGARYYQVGTWTLETPAAVPIPAAVWLLGSGLVGFAAIRRRFKR